MLSIEGVAEGVQRIPATGTKRSKRNSRAMKDARMRHRSRNIESN
jgi:hypothetical protein